VLIKKVHQLKREYKVLDSETNRFYTLREIKFQKGLKEQHIAALKNLSHPNVMPISQVILDPTRNLQYVLEVYHTRKDITRRLTCIQLKTWFVQLIQALSYCHEVANICHGDISLDNLQLDQNDNLLLSNFNIS